MMTQPAGRHRKGTTAQRPLGFLRAEYPSGDVAFLNSGIAANGSPVFSPAGSRRALRAALARDRRAFALAMSSAVAGVIGAVLFGSFAPLHSTWIASGGPGAAGGPPQAPVPWSAAPLGSPSGGPVPQRPLQSPLHGPPRRPGESPSSPRLHRLKPEPRPRQEPAIRQAADVRTRASLGQGAAAGKGAHGSSSGPPRHAKPAPQVVVTYAVTRQWPGGFQGEVQVVNNGAEPIADWQAVVSLPGDTVTSVRNANGFVSNHILLLSPDSAAQVVSADGGTLDVFFVASGTETVPAACAFNQTLCG